MLIYINKISFWIFCYRTKRAEEIFTQSRKHVWNCPTLCAEYVSGTKFTLESPGKSFSKTDETEVYNKRPIDVAAQKRHVTSVVKQNGRKSKFQVPALKGKL